MSCLVQYNKNGLVEHPNSLFPACDISYAEMLFRNETACIVQEGYRQPCGVKFNYPVMCSNKLH